jgi:hypothetical protein
VGVGGGGDNHLHMLCMYAFCTIHMIMNLLYTHAWFLALGIIRN